VSAGPTVGIVSAGEMGAGVGRLLRDSGIRVVTTVDGRGERTRDRAAGAGMEDVGSLAAVVREADVLLSILPPGRALDLAEAVGRDAGPLYADCNAISPATARAIGAVVGDRYVDAGIIGGPSAPRIYASGPHSAELKALPLDVRSLGGEIGQASALKMCYAALTKGLSALITESMVAADANGVTAALRDELGDSQRQFLAGADRLPGVVPKAYRWVAEMQEIAATFEEAGMTPQMLLGAADVYNEVEAVRVEAESPLDRTEALVRALRRALSPRRPVR
jgi:3-hydroxyisobutyrate dehydrogenase-like beta-hydroxyacid dehydrogenase